MRYFTLLLLCLVFLKASGQGIDFIGDHTWDQVKMKAKNEGKSIFVEVYSTWCIPCKEMERHVFSTKMVGDFYRDKFVSIRIRADTSKNDNDEIKGFYALGKEIIQRYRITVFPTYLFFNADGTIIHKSIGGKAAEEFIRDGENALDVKTQYYTQLREFEAGSIDPNMLKYLARYSALIRETEMSKKAASRFLITVKSDDLFTGDNLHFLTEFCQNSNDRGFQIFFNNEKRIDSIMGVGYAENYLDYLIAKEEIDPIIFADTSVLNAPDWKKIAFRISRKYNKVYANRTILSAKVRWYEFKNNWPEFSKNKILYNNKYGDNLGNWYLNNDAWAIFQRSNKRKELFAALAWSQKIIDSEPLSGVYTDTYAHILYKLGDKKKALKYQGKAIELDPSNGDIRADFQKMLNDEKIWP